MILRLLAGVPAALIALSSCGSPQAQAPAGFRDPLHGSLQLVLVRTASWDASGGVLSAFERRDPSSPWTPVGTDAAMTLGAAGLAWGRGLHGDVLGEGPVKREGDMRSPAGAFTLSAVFGLAGHPEGARFAMPYIVLDSTVECVDDPSSRYYNLIVDRRTVSEVDWKASEHMQRVGADYAWGVVVDHNRDPRASGKGSCIFIHVWGGPTKPTEGCTSLDEGRLVALLEWLRPSARPVLVQLPDQEYGRLAKAWGLPTLIRGF